MVTLDGIRKRIGLSRKKREDRVSIDRSSLIRSVSTGLDKVTEATLGEAKREERVPPGIPVNRLELLYKLDGQIFGIINKFVRDIIGPGYIVQAEDGESKNAIISFSNNREIGFMRMLRFIVRDCLIYGNAYFEIVYNREHSDIVQLIPIDPKTMDFQRDNLLFIARDKKDGKPIGYEQTTTTAEKIKFDREKIAHFTFYQLGDTELGMSPLEPIYKPILYKLNIEDAVGEVYSKGAYPIIIATVGDDKGNYPTSEEINKLENDIKNISSKTAFVLPYWIKMVRMESGRLERVKPTEELGYFTNLIAGALGASKGENGSEDYERTVISLQKALAEQVEEQVFARLIKIKGLKEVPTIKFVEVTPSSKLSRNRRRAVLARYGLLTWDEDLEQYIRLEEGLPPLKLPLTPEEIERRSYVQPRRARHLTKEDIEEDEKLLGE